MSWQRILESARRNGFPVIVTDIAGREPMVIMPFDAFEEMNEAYQVSLKAWEDEGESVEYSDLEPDPEAAFDAPLPSYSEEGEVTVENREDSTQSVDEPSHEGRSQTSEDVSHLSMEDRFYLEPVDDES